MFDELIIAAISALIGGGFVYILKHKEDTYIPGVEPEYTIGRGDRSPHVHHYDTMDAATNGKFVCGTCRKVAPNRG